ncbi:hypothetical protein BN874_890008 [Candidatus Contendobacter odensis Run_B_J11]|uniref:Uncharacterized protein n=1 Tax=Candidatus Contendobacter odensis Run_B_J11 TaxID=1400861 RepID=A0A7U7GGF4_9GAMM|nr:hypothetical protein BN874_890008 [Candidatus Contendobacter odensis Run_B_J11]
MTKGYLPLSPQVPLRMTVECRRMQQQFLPWVLFWATGLDPFDLRPQARGHAIEFFDVLLPTGRVNNGRIFAVELTAFKSCA